MRTLSCVVTHWWCGDFFAIFDSRNTPPTCHNCPSDAEEVFLEAECQLPIERKGQCLGMWRQMVFQNRRTSDKHVVLVKGDLNARPVIPARVHSECFTGDLLGSRRCDCGAQLDQAFRVITQVSRATATARFPHPPVPLQTIVVTRSEEVLMKIVSFVCFRLLT